MNLSYEQHKRVQRNLCKTSVWQQQFLEMECTNGKNIHMGNIKSAPSTIVQVDRGHGWVEGFTVTKQHRDN